MTSKNTSSKKIKNLLNYSTMKILIFLSIIIILILIYLKLNSKELFASVANVNNYFTRYFAIQDLYKSLQSKLDAERIIINDLANDIQTVLDGEVMTPQTTTPIIQPTTTT